MSRRESYSGRDFEDFPIIDGVEVQIGDTVAVVIRGGGANGVFTGVVAAMGPDFLRLVLTTATDGIPTGTVLTIRRRQIAAIGRVTTTTTGVGGVGV